MISNSSRLKISPELLEQVETQKNFHKKYNCLIYSNNFVKTKQFLQGNFDLEKIMEFPFIKAIGVDVNFNQIISLAALKSVEYISKPTKVFAQISISKKIMNIDQFYKSGIYGQNVTIAMIDTGISNHLDFVLPQNRIVKFVDLINFNENNYDDNGHGTFVAGVACGNGIASGGKYSGIAPKSNIVMIKALEGNGETSAYKILEAMQWVYDNYKKYNIKVVCMSFGSAPLGKNDPMLIGAEVLWNAGIVVVAAAGNSGPDRETIKSPGISGRIITVGGLDDGRDEGEKIDVNNFKVAEFSSRGPAGRYYKPDLIASAVDIIGVNYKGGYTKMSGTSVSTPMIAGIAALISCKYPFMSPDGIKSQIINNCKKLEISPNDEGHGYFSKL